MKNFSFLIRKARSLLTVIPPSKHRHVTFLLVRHRIVSIGWSKSFKTHPKAAQYGMRFHSIHSELDAILNYEFPPFTLQDTTLVNIRIMANGEIGMSRPCEKCQQLIKDFNIRKVFFTNRNGNFEQF